MFVLEVVAVDDTPGASVDDAAGASVGVGDGDLGVSQQTSPEAWVVEWPQPTPAALAVFLHRRQCRGTSAPR